MSLLGPSYSGDNRPSAASSSSGARRPQAALQDRIRVAGGQAQGGRLTKLRHCAHRGAPAGGGTVPETRGSRRPYRCLETDLVYEF